MENLFLNSFLKKMWRQPQIAPLNLDSPHKAEDYRDF